MPSLVIGTVYLLHYTVSVYGKRHYLGFTQKPVDVRLDEHNSGGPVASQVSILATRLGGKAILVKTWEGVSVDFEKKLKRERHLGRHCPLCEAAPVALKAESRPVALKAR